MTQTEMIVIANNPQEMVESQLSLIKSVRSKYSEAIADARDNNKNVLALDEANLSSSASKRLRGKAVQRALYYRKMQTALEAGYFIVPNMPCDTIAIRVKRPSPRGYLDTEHGNPEHHTNRTLNSEILPSGIGDYANPQPFEESYESKDSNDKTIHKFSPTRWDYNIELPIEFCKVEVVQRTGKCMARKIFDEIAIAPTRWNRAGNDPMVLGLLYDKSRNGRHLTFLISWFLDPKTL